MNSLKVPESHESLEKILLRVLEKSKQNGIFSIGEILNMLSEKGRLIILILLALPFCQPLQIPGVSIPFGISIMIVGFRVLLGKNVWFPQKIQQKKISGLTLQKITNGCLRIVNKFKFFVHHRWTWACNKPFMRILNGIQIILLGLFMSIPFPIPLSNLPAAWGILLMGIGLLEKDGLFVCLSYVFILICTALLVIIGISIWRASLSA